MRPIAIQAAAMAMLQAIQLGLLNKVRAEGRSPTTNEGVAAGLLAILHADPNNPFNKVIDDMTDEKKTRVVEVLAMAVEELTFMHSMFHSGASALEARRAAEIAAIRDRLPPEAIDIAENHKCELCPAYDECELPSVAEGGPRKELKPGEWKPVPIESMAQDVATAVKH